MAKAKSKTEVPIHVSVGTFLGDSLYYYCEVDYDYIRDCRTSECDSICRCARISNAHIKSVDTCRLVADLTKTCKIKDPLDQYCLSRIATHGPLADLACYRVQVGAGYYGDEIESVRLDSTATATVVRDFMKVLARTDSKSKVLDTLEYEYGYVLPKLQTINSVAISSIPIGQILIGQTEHYRRLNRTVVQRYQEQKDSYFAKLPQVVVLQTQPNQYNLIDGYHRLAAARHNAKTKIVAVVCK